MTAYLTQPNAPASVELVRLQERYVPGKGRVWLGTLIRHGLPVARFLATPHQKSQMQRGERIRIEDSQVEAAAKLFASTTRLAASPSSSSYAILRVGPRGQKTTARGAMLGPLSSTEEQASSLSRKDPDAWGYEIVVFRSDAPSGQWVSIYKNGWLKDSNRKGAFRPWDQRRHDLKNQEKYDARREVTRALRRAPPALTQARRANDSPSRARRSPSKTMVRYEPPPTSMPPPRAVPMYPTVTEPPKSSFSKKAMPIVAAVVCWLIPSPLDK